MSTITITLRDVPFTHQCLIHIGSEDEEFSNVEGKSFSDLTASQQVLQSFELAVKGMMDLLGVDKEEMIMEDAGYISTTPEVKH